MNPMQLIQSVMQNQSAMRNPIISNAMGMYKSQNYDGLKSLAENMCKERGMTLDEARKKLGI